MTNDTAVTQPLRAQRATSGKPIRPAALEMAHEPSLSLRQTFVAIGVVYAVLTLISSALALAEGSTTDTHVHILLRFGVTTIGVGAFYVYGVLRRRFASVPSLAMGLITYVIALAATMAGVWLYGRVDALHPDAYRDMFLNFTAVAVALSAVWSAAAWWLRRGRSAAAPDPSVGERVLHARPMVSAPHGWLAITAIVLEVVLALGAIGGGLALILGPRGEIIPLPVAALAGSPFDSYLVPGVILLTVLGVGPLIAAILSWRANAMAPLLAIAVGGVLLVWLAVQIAIIGFSTSPPLQPIYLGLGAVITAVGVAWSRKMLRRSGAQTHEALT